MPWWPGWDSADSAGFWSNLWFGVGIVCLFAVCASEVISHVYGLRKDALLTDKLGALAATQRAQVNEQRNIEKESASIPKPPPPPTPKVLTQQQQQMMIASLRRFAGQKVRIVALVGSDDRLVADFVEVFRAAGWDVDPASPSKVVLGKRLFGLQPTVNPAGTDPPGFAVLVETLSTLGLASNTGFADQRTPIGVIDMKIGILGSATD